MATDWDKDGNVARFLHTGDWQLGMTRHFLDDEAQARFTAARLDAVRKIGQIAAEEACDFVVVCGDVMDSNHLDRQVVLRTLDVLAQFTVPVYLLPGNHDPLDAASILNSQAFSHARPDHITVLDRPGVWPTAAGVELVAAPWTSKRPLTDLVSAASADLIADGTLRVAVGHGGVDVLSPNLDDPAVIVTEALDAALADGRLHFVALGDRHSLTSVGESGRIWYSGAPEPTDFDEVNPGQVLLVDLDADGCQTRAIMVATWRFLQPEAFELRDADDISVLASWLDEQSDKERTIVRLTLVGTLTLREMAALDEVLDRHRHLYAALDLWERHSDIAVVTADEDLADLDLAGFAADAADELRLLANGGEDATAAQDALALLYRLQQGAA